MIRFHLLSSVYTISAVMAALVLYQYFQDTNDPPYKKKRTQVE
jgi:hypothetical protein